MGVLEQTAVSGSTMTVEEGAMSRMTHVMAAREAMEEATEARRGDEGRGATVGGRGAHDAVGGATAKKRASTVLKGLGFSDAMMTVRCDTLSGGWRMRVALARLLLSPAGDARRAAVAGVLLLDEPSNHLDSTSRDWLVRWIKSYPGTVVLVSHDENSPRASIACRRVREGVNCTISRAITTRFLREREARRAAAAAALEREAPRRQNWKDSLKSSAPRRPRRARQIETKGFGQGERQDGRLSRLGGPGRSATDPGTRKSHPQAPDAPKGREKSSN